MNIENTKLNNLKTGLKLSFFSFFSLAILNCNSNPANNTEINKNSGFEKNQNIINIEKTKETDNNVFIAEVSDKKGANISFDIDLSNINSGFNTLANENGALQKNITDIKDYLIYLITDSSSVGYPAGGDPLANIATGGGPFIITNNGATAKTIRFSNVQPSGSNSYYVAIRARDASSNDILKDNNGSGTAWGATTAGITPKVAVSSGVGVSVASDLSLSSTNILKVTANLADGVGAKIDGNISPISGENISNSDINNSLRVLSQIDTVVGIGVAGFTGDGASAKLARINDPQGIAFDTSNNLYIADSVNDRLRKVDNSTGNISTIAGGGAGCALPCPATDFIFSSVIGLAIDSQNDIYVSDSLNHNVYKIDISSGNISLFAGTGSPGHNGDNIAANSAQLNQPRDLFVDSSDNLYIADQNNHRIRKVNASNSIISTVAGDGNVGDSGEGGLAISANLNTPTGIAVHSSGDIYIADSANNKIKKVDNATGNISTIAGTGSAGYNGDSILASGAELNQPTDLIVNFKGDVYIIDKSNHRLRKIDNTTSNISTIAGRGIACVTSSGDCGDGGELSNADLNAPNNIALNDIENIYFSDRNNNKIRRVYFD